MIITVRHRIAVLLVALVAVAGASLSAQASSAHAAVTLDRTTTVGSSTLFDVAAGYGKMATYALTACGAPRGAKALGAAANLRYALRLTTFGRVTVGWAGALYSGFQRFTGQDFCEIALQASVGAAWAAYWGSTGHRIPVRIYVAQEHRRFAFDVCHSYLALNGTWRVYDMKTSSMGSGCPRG